MEVNDEFSFVPKRLHRNLEELLADSQARLLHPTTTTTAVVSPIDVSGDDVVQRAKDLLGSSYYYQPPTGPTVPQAGAGGSGAAAAGIAGGGAAAMTAGVRAAGAFRGKSLEERLNRHENDILRGISERARERTQTRLRDQVDALLKGAWERERDIWVQELIGDRRLGGIVSAGASAPPLFSGGPSEEPGRPLLSGSDYRSMRFSNGEDRASSGVWPSVLDASTILEHANLVMRHVTPQTANLALALTTATTQPGTATQLPTAVQRAIEAFLDLPGSHPTSTGMLAVNTPGYRTSWQLLASLSSVASSAWASFHRRPTPFDQARGALNQMSAQFFAHIVDRLRKQPEKQQQSRQRYSNFAANAIAQYVEVTLGLDAVVPAEATQAVWATIFYCLRCGNAVAALHVMVSVGQASGVGSVHGVIDDAVSRLIEAYASRQGSDADNLWGRASRFFDSDGLVHDPLNQDDMAAVQDLLQTRAANASSANSNSVFQSGVCALLSGALLPSDESIAGFCDIEDYLTSRLWQALVVAPPRDDDPASASSFSPERSLVRLGRSIRDLGSEYFGTRDPYSYAWPLLATQQYGTALRHLASTGGPVGLLQAAHLGLVMTNLLGISLVDLRDDEERDEDSGIIDSSHELMTRLLVRYAHAILPHAGAVAAMEYAVRIPTEARATLEVARLIASSADDLGELAGTINEQGEREGGSESLNTFGLDVSRVLSEAAELILRAPNVDRISKGRAAMCYMLAGQYANVLQLLSHCISPPEERDDEDRDYWIQQAKEFRAHYLAKRTHVLRVLERDSPSVMETINTLLGLNQFYGELKAGRRDEAWGLLAHLNLLPTSRTDLSSKEAAYRARDPLVQRAMPTLMSTTVATLFQEYQNLRSNLNFPGWEVTQGRIDQIKSQAKVYVAFASSIGMSGDQMQALQRMDALMG
jgi:hypothetical protein